MLCRADYKSIGAVSVIEVDFHVQCVSLERRGEQKVSKPVKRGEQLIPSLATVQPPTYDQQLVPIRKLPCDTFAYFLNLMVPHTRTLSLTAVPGLTSTVISSPR